MQHRQGERSLFPLCQQVRHGWPTEGHLFGFVPAQDVLLAWDVPVHKKLLGLSPLLA